METDIVGVSEHRFDGGLLAATRRFEAAADVTREVGAGSVGVAHTLIALARMPGGVAAGLFARQGIPPDVLAAGLPGGGAGQASDAGAPRLGRLPVTAGLRAAFDAAAATARVDERVLLIALLARLEAGAVDLLAGYGRVDLDAWLTEVKAGRRVGDVFGPDGAIDPAAFGPGASRVLAVTVTEAGALGHERYGIALLLHALATTPGGLLEQAYLFLRRDVRALREQTLTLAGSRPRAGRGPAPERAPVPDEPVRQVL
ncbi:hypothetical protein GT354_37760, partial [Streptomyces sp. SID3343]|nr:hypothetical protein [Streptomyces sp. SID3343]